jgi:chaperonin GroEL
MYQEKEILKGEESMELLVAGVDKLCDIVKTTLGPNGQNVMYTDMYNIPRVTNDGATIAKQITSTNETEQMAIDSIRQEGIRTNMLAGDASTTFFTLTQSIIHEGLKSKKHSLKKREEIQEHCQIVLNELKDRAKPVETFDDIKQVATVSVESEELGHLIAEANENVGKDGKIDVQESETKGVNVEYINGLEIDEGYIAEFMMNNDRGEAVVNNPYILLVDSKLSNILDILPVLQNLADNGIMEVVLLCDGLEGNMLPIIANNKRLKYTKGENVIEIYAVKFPTIRKPEYVEDISLVSGAKVFGMSTGLFPDQAPRSSVPQNPQADPQYIEASREFIRENLGRCEKVIITAKKTTFIGAKGDISDKIKSLETQKENSPTDEQEAIDNRIARLKGKVAVIKVGSSSGVDQGYLKDKIDDAVYATKGAIQEGAVRGGGLELKEIAETLPDGILKVALQTPYYQIQENAGADFSVELNDFKEIFEIKDNVYDSVKSTRIVIERACSYAGTFLTTGSSIATKRIKPKE